MKQGGAVTPQPVTGGRGKSDGKTAKCRGTTPEDVSHAPISILATRQSRIEQATTAGNSTFWNCNTLFRCGEVKERQRKVDAAGPGVTLLGFPDPYHRGERQRSPGRVPSLGCTLSVSRHLPPLGRLLPAWVVRSPVVFLVATPQWPPAAALPVWTFCGAQYLGKIATLVPSRWSFARRHMLDTLADWRGLQRHCGGIGGRGLFAPQLTYPGSSWEQGSHLPYTPTGRLR